MPNRPAKSGAENGRDFKLIPAGGLDRDAAMLALAEAATASDLAVRLAHLLRTAGLADATVGWSRDWPLGIQHGPPSAPRDALAAISEPGSAPGWRVRPLLAGRTDATAANLAWRAGADPADASVRFDALIRFAGIRLAELLDIETLQASLARREGAERLQRALFAIADMAGSDQDMPTMLRGVHAIVGELMYAENFYIALYDDHRDALRFIYFADTVDGFGPAADEWVPLQDFARGLTWYVIHDARPLMGPTSRLRQMVSGDLEIQGPDSVDWLGVPMLRGRKVHGALVVQSYQEGQRYTPADMALLGFVAEHVLTALERKHGQEELELEVRNRTGELAEANSGLRREVEERERGERLQAALYQLAALAGYEETMDRFYSHVHGIVGDLINVQNFYIALLSDDGQTLEFPYYVDALERGHGARPLGKGLTEYVLRTGKPLLAGPPELEALADAGEIDYVDVGNPATCWLGVPLLTTDGVLGTLAVQSYTPDVVYGPREAELLTFVSYQVANSLQRRRSADALVQANAELEARVHKRTQSLREEIAVRERVEEELKHRVMHDALTGLPNRIYLRDRLERAISRCRRQQDRKFALLYLDVDRFKIINDNLGHQVGDFVLEEVARRLGTCVRSPDVVARLSGDEFAILLEDVPVPETACQVAQRVLKAFASPVQLADRELEVSASVGIAIGDSRYSAPDEILRDSDTALYSAKASGRGCFHLFDELMHSNAMNVLEVETALRAGLVRREFEPYFQPLVRLEDGSTVGYETLLRWNHPTRGLLVPGEFLKIAEDSGLIDAIDWQIFEAACTLGAPLVADGGYLTVNVSPRHFRQEDLDLRLAALLERTGLPAACLRIEVTEGTLLRDPESAAATLYRLRDAGILAALDDFGTGYSSLNYVNLFPVQSIKIDRSFMAGLDQKQTRGSAAIVQTILALAQALESEVIAEGVETEGQRAVLLSLGCVYGQGYLFGRPAPAAHWLAARGS